MRRHSQKRFAEEAARFMVEGTESEYLHAKERAMMMLGLSSQTRLPSNRKVRELVSKITKAELLAACRIPAHTAFHYSSAFDLFWL